MYKKPKKMKKNIVNFFLVLLILFIVGCAKDFLTEEPRSAIHKGEVFSSTTNAELAVKGIYRDVSLPWGNKWANIANQQTDECMNDEQYMSAYFSTKRGTYTSSHPMVYELWTWCYKAIADANAVIGNVPKIEATSDSDEETKKRQVAEAKFLRAFVYFDIARIFGPVPLWLDDVNEYSEDLFMGRTPVMEILDTCISDLVYALDYLPTLDDRIDGRASKWAASMLLAKIYMWKAGYGYDAINGGLDLDFPNGDVSTALPWLEKAADLLLDIEINSGHSLKPVSNWRDYGNIFLNNQRTDGAVSNEIIFDIQYVSSNNIWSAWGNYSVNGGNSWHGEFFYPWGQVYVGVDFALSFDDDDLRYSWNIAPYTVWKTAGDEREYWSNWTKSKHRLQNEDRQANAIIYRYADVLLMLAEIVNEIAGGPTATFTSTTNGLSSRTPYDYINEVRSRVYIETIDDTYLDARSPADDGTDDVFLSQTEMHWIYEGTIVATDTSGNVNPLNTNRNRWYNHGGLNSGNYQELFRQALRQERMWELCFERIRFFDMRRWGIHYEQVKKFRRIGSSDPFYTSIEDPISKLNIFANTVTDTVIWGGQDSYENLMEFHAFLPIPENSMSVNPNLIHQNLGY